MKQVYSFLYLFFLSFLLTACITDESTIGQDRTKISISGVQDSYTITTFNNEFLEISPQVSSSFDESDLEYSWAYYDTNEAQKIGQAKYKAKEIFRKKDLKEEIGFADGQYTFIFTARSKSTGYSQSVRTQVYTASILSKGFCILKENAAGQTDMDMYNTNTNQMVNDMFTTYQGRALLGKPVALDVLFGQAYMDSKTDQPTGGNLICVTTDEGLVRWVNLQGFQTVMDETNHHYEKVENEKPYRTVQGDGSVFFLTNNGIYSSYTVSQKVSGIFGTLSGNGGSTHVVAVPSKRHTMLYWNETTRSIVLCDINGQERRVESNLAEHPVANTNMDCLTCGVNRADGELVYFLLKDRTTGETYLYYFNVAYTRATLASVEKVDASAFLGRGTSFTVNNNNAKVVYSLVNNKIYAYALQQNGREREIIVTGIPADERMTYISNRYFIGENIFNYFIVATQKDNTYKVYCYEMLGEEIIGQAKQIFTGQGLFKSINYIDPVVTDQMAPSAVPLLDN